MKVLFELTIQLSSQDSLQRNWHSRYKGPLKIEDLLRVATIAYFQRMEKIDVCYRKPKHPKATLRIIVEDLDISRTFVRSAGISSEDISHWQEVPM